MSVRSVDDEIQPDDVDVFESLRPRLGAIAYRLLGSAAEAEDAVQETFLRWQAADREQVQVPAAWLTRVLTNLCLTHLNSARARREVYVGSGSRSRCSTATRCSVRRTRSSSASRCRPPSWS